MIDWQDGLLGGKEIDTRSDCNSNFPSSCYINKVDIDSRKQGFEMYIRRSQNTLIYIYW